MVGDFGLLISALSWFFITTSSALRFCTILPSPPKIGAPLPDPLSTFSPNFSESTHTVPSYELPPLLDTYLQAGSSSNTCPSPSEL